MKRSMKKFLVTCAAAAAVTVCGASAMAADFEVAPAYSNDAANTVTLSIPAAVDTTKQATVLVAPSDKIASVTDADILYVNQGLTTDGTMSTLLLKGTDVLADGKYTVKLGAYVGDTFTIYEGEFQVGEEEQVKYGDVTGDGRVQPNDGATVLMFTSRAIEFTDAQKKSADVTGDNRVQPNDGATILMYTSRVISSFPVEAK